jgi:outer membrane protein OmpA-like peptidoglycan-associated protein
VALIPDEDGAVGGAIASNVGQTAELDKPFTLVETNPGQPPGKVAMTTQDQLDKEFAGALAVAPRAPAIFRVAFANAESNLDVEARTVVDSAIAAAKAMAFVDISVVGNADATGNAGDNLQLSLRRAETVRNALVAAGIPAELIDVAYFGANNPLAPNRPNVPEPLNRRVDITIR